MISQELTNKLKERRDDLCKFLDIKNKELIDLNYDKEISSPKFWDDSEKAEKVLKNKKQNKSWIEIYKEISINIEELDVLIELEAKEEELINQYKKTLTSVEELEFKNMLSSEEDKMSAIVRINPGAGGTEGQDWAEILMRMYLMWGEKIIIRLNKLIFKKLNQLALNL